MTTTEEEPFKQELVGQAAKDDKAHPWRFCPIGKHYVRTHVLHIPPSKEHPAGQAVIRHEPCAENASPAGLVKLRSYYQRLSQA